jgi:2-methylisocitrate lyase-like PEP mutase family enzyme
MSRRSTQLRRLFESPETTLMPFGAMPIHAQMAEKAGFPAFEVSGAMAAFWLGVADVGYLTMTEVVQHAAMVARAVDIPVYCDADTGYGFGAPVNIERTVQEFLRAGVAGIHIEDQTDPKKAGGGFGGLHLVSDAEAVARIRVAVDTKNKIDPDFVIVARTDAYGAGKGFDEAIRRGLLYFEAGADVIFFEGVPSWEEAGRVHAAMPGPVYSLVSRRLHPQRTPPIAELTAMKQSIAIVPFFQPGVQEVWNLLLRVKQAGEMAPIDEYYEHIAQFEGTENFVGYGELLSRPSFEYARELEERYLPGAR